MGTDDLFKKRKAAKSLSRSSRLARRVRDRILVVCEGEKTEKYYFDGFRLTNVNVIGCGANTNSLVKIAIKKKQIAIEEKEEYDQVWCVFDRDSFPPQNFNEAFILAKSEGIKIAYSNEAFEIWYLLHFNYYETGFSRDDYEQLLSSLLGFKYEKNSPDMYQILKKRQPNAIRNSKRLLEKYPNLNPESDNPSTTVHELVMELNQWLKQ